MHWDAPNQFLPKLPTPTPPDAQPLRLLPLPLPPQADIYGTCMSSYERRGHVLVKARNLQQCHQRRVSEFWQQSVGLKDNNVSLPGLPICYIYIVAKAVCLYGRPVMLYCMLTSVRGCADCGEQHICDQSWPLLCFHLYLFGQALSMKHECVQQLGKNTMEKVNCTETVSFFSSSGLSGVVQTKTVSVLIMLRTLDNIPFSFGESAIMR